MTAIEVEFYWIDSERDDGWESTEEVMQRHPELEKCLTRGWLVTENSKSITVTSTLTSHEVLSPLTVPKVSIVGKIKRRKRKL